MNLKMEITVKVILMFTLQCHLSPYGPSWFSKTCSYMAPLSDSSNPPPLRSLQWNLLDVISPNIINLDKQPATPCCWLNKQPIVSHTVLNIGLEGHTAIMESQEANECRLLGHLKKGESVREVRKHERKGNITTPNQSHASCYIAVRH